MSLIPAEDVLIANYGVFNEPGFLSWCSDSKVTLFFTVSVTGVKVEDDVKKSHLQ